jgi:single-stranded-DNA-specific exonuclease
MGKEKQLENYLALVALGTVADMMPLLGENRYLVKQGLKAMSRNKRPGIMEISSLAGISPDSIGTEEISWALAPRLNGLDRRGSGIIDASGRTECRTTEDDHPFAGKSQGADTG